jgi:KDO2-lipid IV(A) lauroyltransferase
VNKKQRVVDKIKVYLFLAISILGKILPINIFYWLIENMWDLLWRKSLSKTLTKIVKIPFDKKSDKEIEMLVREIRKNLGIAMVNGILTMKISKHKLRKMVEIEGYRYVQEALNKKSGIIGVSAHFTGLSLLLARMGLEVGEINCYVAMPFGPIQESLKKKFKINFLSSKDAKDKKITKFLEAYLNENKIIAMTLDIYYEKGIPMNFLGKPTLIARGPVILSIRTGAPILPVVIIRTGYTKYKIKIHPPLDLIRTDNLEVDIKVNTERIIKIIESYVEKYPSQWFWVPSIWGKEEDIHKRKIETKILSEEIAVG